MPTAPTGTLAQVQLRRCLELLVGDATPTPAQVTELFAPAFLEAVPADALASMLGTQIRVATTEPTSVTTRGESELVATVELANGSAARFIVCVEDDEPHRFVSFDVGAAAAVKGPRVPWSTWLTDGPAPGAHSELAPGLTAQLDELVAAHRTEHRNPGLLALVSDESARPLWWRAEGLASLDPPAAPSPTMTVRVGSVSKTMTALAVMQLVEAGRVDLDVAAARYLTSVTIGGQYAVDVTVRHLLTHTSALAPRPEVDLGADEGAPVPSVREYYADGVVAAGVPGKAWAYSNDAFTLLGQLVEDVAGVPFADYARDNIFDRLGMTQTSYLRDGRVVAPLFDGFDLELDDVVRAPYREIITKGAGSVFSTPEDMARYGAAILGDGENAHGRVLEPATLRQMVAPQGVELPRPGLTMGLGWLTGQAQGSSFFWHNGGWPGANSEIAVLPAQRRTVLVFANTLAEGLDALCFNLVGALAAAG